MPTQPYFLNVNSENKNTIKIPDSNVSSGNITSADNNDTLIHDRTQLQFKRKANSKIQEKIVKTKITNELPCIRVVTNICAAFRLEAIKIGLFRL